eukprot:863458-Pyramimonas_sp.AAC.1
MISLCVWTWFALSGCHGDCVVGPMQCAARGFYCFASRWAEHGNLYSVFRTESWGRLQLTRSWAVQQTWN